MERVGNIPKIANLGIDPDAQMAINCEWVSRSHPRHGVLILKYVLKGAFDSFEHENLPRTKYDQIIDEQSNKPGEQAFEVRVHSAFALAFAHRSLRRKKLISGRYLGEILRLIICELIDEGVLFLGQNTYKLEIPYSFDTAFLSLMERCALPWPNLPMCY